MVALKLLLVCTVVFLRTLDIMAVRVSKDQNYFLLCGKDVVD